MIRGITIDGPESRDLDDALWVECDPDGWTVEVSIADVAGIVWKGAPADVEASERIASVYRSGGRVSPMLHPEISERRASLLPGKRRGVMAVTLRIGSGGLATEAACVSFGQFESVARLTYEQIPDILHNGTGEVGENVRNAARLAELLLEKRRAAGALAIYDLHTGWMSTEDGYLKRIDRAAETMGYVIVQEMMILANAELARWCAEREVPILFRNHTAKAHAPDRAFLMDQMVRAVTDPVRHLDVVRRQADMALNRAAYGTALQGHYGLNLPAYVHCTSPIRRFADLVVQRQVRASVHGHELPYAREELEGIAARVNTVMGERRAAAAERLKAAANATAEAAIRNGVDFRGADDREFERVAKVLARGGGDPPETFVAEFRRRLEAGTCPMVCIHLVLFMTAGSGWAGLRGIAAEWLGRNPQHAPTLMCLARQISGWPEAEGEPIVGRSGPDHAAVFSVRVAQRVPGHAVVSGWARAGSLKLAEQRATVHLICEALGLSGPDYADLEPQAPAAPVPAPAVVTEGGSAISRLQERCQKARIALPTYAFKTEGPPERPTFTCICRAAGIEREATVAGTKQKAKEAAADEVLRALAGPQRGRATVEG